MLRSGLHLSLFGSGGSPGLVKRVLGPPADKIGEALAHYVEFRAQNTLRILEAAAAKTDLDEPGEIPPRVAGALLDAGSYCDDDIMVEYLGGVLASARTPVGRDDRAARWTNLVTDLAAYDVRLHYVLYQAARDAWLDDTEVEWTHANTFNEHQHLVVVDLDDLRTAMDFTEDEDWEALLSDSAISLLRVGLAAPQEWNDNSSELAKSYGRTMPAAGALLFHPTYAGLQLWAASTGHLDDWLRFSSSEIDTPPIPGISHVSGVLLRDLPTA